MGEGFRALVTPVRSLSCVDSLVFLDRGFPLEAPVTVSAGKRLLLGVNAQMLDQARGTLEALGTQVAGKGRIIRVHLAMFVQVSL